MTNGQGEVACIIESKENGEAKIVEIAVPDGENNAYSDNETTTKGSMGVLVLVNALGDHT